MRQLAYAWILLVLAACGSLGLEEAKTFEDRLAYAYGTNTAVREASTSVLNAGTISSDDMIYIKGVNDRLRLGLDAARDAARIGDMDTAEARLLMITQSLVALQNYMRAKGVNNVEN